jgi:hypothetical protein
MAMTRRQTASMPCAPKFGVHLQVCNGAPTNPGPWRWSSSARHRGGWRPCKGTSTPCWVGHAARRLGLTVCSPTKGTAWQSRSRPPRALDRGVARGVVYIEIRGDGLKVVAAHQLVGQMEVRVMNRSSALSALHADFRATSTQSMPFAGIIFWAVVAIAGRLLSSATVAYLVGFGSGAVFPLALLIDKLRGRPSVTARNTNPLVGMFMQNLVVVAMLWPFVIIAAIVAGSPQLVVLGGAILMGIVWIPYGWAADDPVGMQHAIARCVFSYAAFVFAPPSYRTTIIALVVLLCYGYSLLRMRRVAEPTK